MGERERESGGQGRERKEEGVREREGREIDRQTETKSGRKNKIITHELQMPHTSTSRRASAISTLGGCHA